MSQESGENIQQVTGYGYFLIYVQYKGCLQWQCVAPLSSPICITQEQSPHQAVETQSLSFSLCFTLTIKTKQASWDSSPYVFPLNASFPRHLCTKPHRSQSQQCNNTCAALLSKRSKSGSLYHSCSLSEELKVILKIMLGLLEIYYIIPGCLWAFSLPCLVAYKL